MTRFAEFYPRGKQGARAPWLPFAYYCQLNTQLRSLLYSARAGTLLDTCQCPRLFARPILAGD